MKCFLVSLFLFVSAQFPKCQTIDAAPFSQRHLADVASSVVLAGTVSADVIGNVTHAHRIGRTWQAVGCEAVKIGAVQAASAGLKALLPRERPDGSDNQDSFSGHTATAVAATGWTLGVSVPIAVLVSSLRGAANKHDVVGRLEGAGLGVLVRYGVTRIPQCKGVS